MKEHYSRVYRHHWRKQAYTYIKNKAQKTKKGLPNPRLTNYEQGNVKGYNQKTLPASILITSKSTALLTELSLEAFRVALTRLLSRTYTRHLWYYRILKIPHIILRKHKLPSGGHVDRVSMGMRLAYGVPFARAARINEGETVIALYYNTHTCDPKILKTHIKRASNKLAISVIIK